MHDVKIKTLIKNAWNKIKTLYKRKHEFEKVKNKVQGGVQQVVRGFSEQIRREKERRLGSRETVRFTWIGSG